MAVKGTGSRIPDYDEGMNATAKVENFKLSQILDDLDNINVRLGALKETSNMISFCFSDNNPISGDVKDVEVDPDSFYKRYIQRINSVKSRLAEVEKTIKDINEACN